MENGERDFYFNRGADGQLSTEEIEEIELGSFSIIHFGSATAFLSGPLQAAYHELLQKCLDKDIFISFDPNYRHLLFQKDNGNFIEQSWNFIKSCHFFKVSDEEAMMITGCETAEAAAGIFLQKTKAIFAITLGKDGTMVGMNDVIEIVPSIKVQPVDTTGAGDAFVGAVLYQLHTKHLGSIKAMALEGWKEVIYKANKAGARTCTYMGAMEAFKHLSNDIFNE